MVGDKGNGQCELRMQPPSVSLKQTIFDAKAHLCGQLCCMFVGQLRSIEVLSRLFHPVWKMRGLICNACTRIAFANGCRGTLTERFFWGSSSAAPPSLQMIQDVGHRRFNVLDAS